MKLFISTVFTSSFLPAPTTPSVVTSSPTPGIVSTVLHVNHYDCGIHWLCVGLSGCIGKELWLSSVCKC